MTEQDLVEKVAIAISGAPRPTTRSLNKARAALSVIREALSEPSEAMKENAALQAMMTDWQDITEDDRVAITAIYRAMIAASPIGEK